MKKDECFWPSAPICTRCVLLLSIKYTVVSWLCYETHGINISTIYNSFARAASCIANMVSNKKYEARKEA